VFKLISTFKICKKDPYTHPPPPPWQWLMGLSQFIHGARYHTRYGCFGFVCILTEESFVELCSCVKMRGDRVANRFGRCFHHRKERFDLENLKPADHIVEERHSTYWHHMIVESIDLNEEQPINVIHYYRSSGPSGSGSFVCRDSFPYTPNK
jgi:hypothetical protein